MLSIQLDPELERRLSDLAKRTGQTTSEVARELIEASLEDLEDREVAERRLRERRPTLSSQQVWKELGLDDHAVVLRPVVELDSEAERQLR